MDESILIFLTNNFARNTDWLKNSPILSEWRKPVDPAVFDQVHGTHFAHENGPTTHKMIIKKGPIPPQKPCSQADCTYRKQKELGSITPPSSSFSL